MKGWKANATHSIRTRIVALLAAPIAVTFGSLAWAGAHGTDRPLTGACETEVTQLSPPSTFPVVLAVDVDCHLTHLGLTSGGTEEEIVIPTGPPVGTLLPIQIFVERITYIAANGDELWSTFAGPGTIDLATGEATFHGTETYVGGTGRFHNATGMSQTAGRGSLVDNKGALTISGSISY